MTSGQGVAKFDASALPTQPNRQSSFVLMPNDDPHDLQRFVTAQAPVFETALAELRAGKKRSHWMWFVFPQVRGLGRSSTAVFYGIESLAEAKAYLADPVLGARLEAVTRAVMGWPDRSLHAIFGSPDDMKFRSSMTLFSVASGEPKNLYREALDLTCEGQADEATLSLLEAENSGSS
jgi:uncharacterized protein (DUF1810 family)